MRKDKRDSFIFYRSFYEAVKVLSKEDKADLFEAIAIYALDQKNFVLNPLPKAMFKLIKPQLDANYKPAATFTSIDVPLLFGVEYDYNKAERESMTTVGAVKHSNDQHKAR